MVFSSVTFLYYFLPAFFALYYLLPAASRNAILLCGSLVFYAWGEARHLPLLLGTVAVSYLCGLGVARSRGRAITETGRGGDGGWPLAIGVGLQLFALAYFKYLDFLVAGIGFVATRIGWTAPRVEPVALPLGISFFSFHAISYLVDVYRRKTPAERDPFALAMYLAMFPQLVAGPIIRFATVAKQIHRRRHTPARVRLGVELFIVGLAQKVLLANTLGAPADRIFAIDPRTLPPSTAWLGACCYALQIYFDFGGYSTMAIGLGLMTGFGFPRNFRDPYIARSMTDFWRRWHLSLSRWFRDYLYIPLGGNQRGPARTYLNLVVVFLLCGLWHGASLGFAVWGLYHGAFLVLERAGLGRLLSRAARPLQHAYALVAILGGWVIFRADSLGRAGQFIAAMSGRAHIDGLAAYPPAGFLSGSVVLALVVGALLCTPLASELSRAQRRAIAKAINRDSIYSAARIGRAGLLFFMFGLSAIRLAGGTYNPFIYFRF